MAQTYAGDPQHKSQDLASAILAASSPPEIIAACSAVDSFLRHHTSDQSRWFFSLAFPTLIRKTFGFHNSSTPKHSSSSKGWMDLAYESNDADLRGTLFDLFSPTGVFMSSIYAVDRLSLVKYLFPVERLPEWVRVVLSSDRDCRFLPDLCPLFKGRIKRDSFGGSSFEIHLNVFEYYMFWFAYYPLYRGDSDSFETGRSQSGRKFRLENWASSFPGFTGNPRPRKLDQKIQCNLYIRILYSYIIHFVPLSDLHAHQPFGSYLLHHPSGFNGSFPLHAEFFVNTIVQFWFVYNDFSPLSLNHCKSFGVSFSSRMLLGKAPPSAGLADVVKLVVKYMNISLISAAKSSQASGSPRWMISGSYGVLKPRDTTSPYTHSWNSWIQRPLYRFILRSFLFYPVGSSMKNASEVFSLWISYIELWEVHADNFEELDGVVDNSAKVSIDESLKSSSGGYSSSWEGYVLSNYLFYSSLVMHFIGFAHKFLHTDPEVIVQMILKVINILTSSAELLELIKNVDIVFHSNPAKTSNTTLNSLRKFVPSIHEQLQDWEYGLCENDADGSLLCEKCTKDLRLFSNDDHGAYQLLQRFLIRAEFELQAIECVNLRRMDQLRTQISRLFGDAGPAATKRVAPHPPPRDEIFRPRNIGNAGNAPGREDGIAWLAKIVARLSGEINRRVAGLEEEMKMALCWVVRRFGLRANLRVLASKWLLLVLMLLLPLAAAFIRRAFYL